MHKFKAFRYSCIALAGVGLPVTAAEWTNTASVTPGVMYTDNVCLSDSDTEDQWIGLITPAGTVEADGRRANLSLDGAVEINTLSNSKLRDLDCSRGNFRNREQFAPRLNGSADAILVENWFYIDGTAYAGQNRVTPFASGGGDSIDRTGNTNTTYSYSVSPYIARRFKDAAEFILRYTWDEQFNSSDAVRDSTEERVNGVLGSVPGASRISWGLQGDYSNVNYSNSRNPIQDNQDSELKSAQLNLGYQLSRRWQLNGFYGKDWNDFVSYRDDIDGTFWDVGLRWTPNVRTVVEAGVGDRFFGNNPRFSITHRHKRSFFTANYAKTVTYDRNIRTLPGSPPGSPDLPPPPGVDPGVTTVNNSPILDERFTLGYSFQGRRTGFGISAFQSDQTREGGRTDTGFRDATYTGVTISADRMLALQTSVTLSANWNEQDPKNNSGEIRDGAETWTGSLRVARQLSQRTNLGLTYLYTDRQSDNEFNSYKENRVTLDLRIDL